MMIGFFQLNHTPVSHRISYIHEHVNSRWSIQLQLDLLLHTLTFTSIKTQMNDLKPKSTTNVMITVPIHKSQLLNTFLQHSFVFEYLNWYHTGACSHYKDFISKDVLICTKNAITELSGRKNVISIIILTLSEDIDETSR